MGKTRIIRVANELDDFLNRWTGVCRQEIGTDISKVSASKILANRLKKGKTFEKV